MFKLHHIPRCVEPFSGITRFKTIKDAEVFLDTHQVYFLAEQGVYISYEKAAIETIKLAVDEFITNSSGYPVQICEFEIVRVK